MDDTTQPQDPDLLDITPLTESTMNLSLETASNQSNSELGNRPPTPHPMADLHTKQDSSGTSNAHTITQKRSFHIDIRSNGRTHEGSEQELNDNDDFPTHFEPANPNPPDYQSNSYIDHLLYLLNSSIDHRPHYDLNLHMVPINFNTFLVINVPTTLTGNPLRVTCQDVVIFNNEAYYQWRIIGIARITLEDRLVTYVAYSSQIGMSLFVLIPCEWSTEANWSEWFTEAT